MVTAKIFIVSILFSLKTSNVVFAPIPLVDVSEGGCLSPEPPHVSFQFDWMLEFVIDAKYTPLGSSYYYYLMHMMLKGTPPADYSDWDQMCLTTDAGLSLTNHGYGGKSFGMSCDILSMSSLSCYPEDEPSNTTILSLTWAYNKQYVIFTICSAEKMKAWSLMSKEKVVEAVAKEKALQYIKGIGFDPAKARTLNYSGCKG